MLSWTEPLTQITPPNVMLFRSTFSVNPFHAQLLDCLHSACSCLLTCIFGVNIPTVGIQKLRPKSSWKTLNHALLLLAFLVLFPLGALACTLNYFLCPLRSGTWLSREHGSWTAAITQAAVAAAFSVGPSISLLRGASLVCRWVLLSPLAFQLPSLGRRGGWVCARLSKKSPAWESYGPWYHCSTSIQAWCLVNMPGSKYGRKCGVPGADWDGDIATFTSEWLHWHP